jgi:MFS transporter, MHS family, proline/betaine transporter
MTTGLKTGREVHAEMFPTRVRNIGLALSYNFAVAIFGGFGQFIVVWLIQTTGDPVAPAYYVVGAAFVGTIAALPLGDRTGQPLP